MENVKKWQSKYIRDMETIETERRAKLWAIALDKAREQLGDLDNVQIAALCGISVSMFNHYTQGRHLPTSAKWLKINKATGISPNFILLGIGKPLTHEIATTKDGVVVVGIRTTGEFYAALDLFAEKYTVQIPSGINSVKPSKLVFVIHLGLCKVCKAEKYPVVVHWRQYKEDVQ